jgi:hypothetical protein
VKLDRAAVHRRRDGADQVTTAGPRPLEERLVQQSPEPGRPGSGMVAP